MPIASEVFQEMRVLAQFNPTSALSGIKVHHDAEPEVIQATQRLFARGLISQTDGGYLTSAGQELLHHLDTVITVLSSELPD